MFGLLQSDLNDAILNPTAVPIVPCHAKFQIPVAGIPFGRRAERRAWPKLIATMLMHAPKKRTGSQLVFLGV